MGGAILVEARGVCLRLAGRGSGAPRAAAVALVSPDDVWVRAVCAALQGPDGGGRALVPEKVDLRLDPAQAVTLPSETAYAAGRAVEIADLVTAAFKKRRRGFLEP